MHIYARVRVYSTDKQQLWSDAGVRRELTQSAHVRTNSPTRVISATVGIYGLHYLGSGRQKSNFELYIYESIIGTTDYKVTKLLGRTYVGKY